MQKILIFIAFSFVFTNAVSQDVTSKIVDAETQEPIPYATIQFSEFDGVMSNEEGIFTLNRKDLYENVTKITVSCLGYKKYETTFQSNFPKIIQLQPDIMDITPVAITNKTYTVKEILNKIEENLSKNYQSDYSKSDVFVRNSGTSNLKDFRILLNESTIKNINQALLDNTFGKLKNKFVYLNEFVGDVAIHQQKESKLLVNKSLTIQNKEEIATAKQLQKDFIGLMNDNFKSDSNLIIKTGIIRLDKTESVDSISRAISNEKNDSDKNKSFTESRNNRMNKLLEQLFIHSKSNVDFINHSGKYEFNKTGYASYDGDWLYVLTFAPKGSGLYKGKIFVDAQSFAIVKAEIQGANEVFEKKFNLFGVNANALTYKSTVIFKKVNDTYLLKYYLLETNDEVKIDRPITVVEKNDNVSGKKRINKVEVQMKLNTVNYDKIEMVFGNLTNANSNDYNNLKPNLSFETTKKTQYDPEFWKGYKILTPEKAIQELKIED